MKAGEVYKHRFSDTFRIIISVEDGICCVKDQWNATHRGNAKIVQKRLNKNYELSEMDELEFLANDRRW